jgi:hypothetical protein
MCESCHLFLFSFEYAQIAALLMAAFAGARKSLADSWGRSAITEHRRLLSGPGDALTESGEHVLPALGPGLRHPHGVHASVSHYGEYGRYLLLDTNCQNVGLDIAMRPPRGLGSLIASIRIRHGIDAIFLCLHSFPL